MKLRSLYHKGTGEGIFSVGRWIILWTGFLGLFHSRWKSLPFNYSHEELWIPDDKGFFHSPWVQVADKRIRYYGQCFSSTTRGDAEGVRFAPASEVLKHPERWDYIEFEVDDEWWADYLDEMKQEVGKKYDFMGISGFILPFGQQDDNKWYCSEICCWVKNMLTVTSFDPPISPRRSAMLLAKDWGEPKSL